MMTLMPDDGPRPLCHFTRTTWPKSINPAQLPVRKEPFATVHRQLFTHDLTLVLAEAAAKQFEKAMAEDALLTHQRYAMVHMKPSELLSGDFFNTYVKTGDIMMISEGNRETHNTLSLSQGVLRIWVDKATYEMMGLQGKPVPSLGRKHIDARFAIEIDLRQPCMVHGRKGFERVVWALENVLQEALAWLFLDLNDPALTQPNPLTPFAPQIRRAEPRLDPARRVIVPEFPRECSQDGRPPEQYIDLLEWLTLAFANSPRVDPDDVIDPYLCRYALPGSSSDAHRSFVQSLITIKWRGLLSVPLITKILATAIKTSGSKWFAISSTAFDDGTYTILKTTEHAMTWKYKT